MSNILSHSEHEAPADRAESSLSSHSSGMMKPVRTALILLFCAISGGCATASPAIKHPANVIKPEQGPENKAPQKPKSPEKGNKSCPDSGKPEADDEDIPCEERGPEDPLACRQV